MRETYNLKNISNEKLVDALIKTNGKVDEALALLF